MRLFRLLVALFVFLILGFALYGSSAQQGDADKIVMRDGKDFYGRLNSVNEKTVKVSGKSYERAKVKLIRLAAATNTTPEISSTDLVIMRDSKSTAGHVTRVTDNFVFQNNIQLKREAVAVIKFADGLTVLNSIPVPTPNPTPTVSPTPAKGIVPAEEASLDKEKKDNKDSRKGKDLPPWFDTDDCGLKTTPYVFVDGSLIDNGKGIRCRMWINVCGTVIERQKTVDAKTDTCWNAKDLAQPLICCDIWSKYAANPDSFYDPKKDADGDGIPNDQDDDPLKPGSK